MSLVHKTNTEPLKGFLSDTFILDSLFNCISVDSVTELDMTFLSCRMDSFNNPILIQSKKVNERYRRTWSKFIRLHLDIENISHIGIKKIIKPHIDCALHQDFYVDNKKNFIQATSIQIGDELLTFSFDTKVMVKKIELLKNEGERNIHEFKNIVDNNNFFANCILTR